MSQVTRALAKRIAKLERNEIRLRQGVLDGADSALIGAAEIPKTPISVIGGRVAGDRVSILKRGNDALALNPNPLGPGDVGLDELSGDVHARLDEPNLRQKRIYEAMNYIGTSSGGGWPAGDYYARRQNEGTMVATGIALWVCKFAWDPAEHFPGAKTVKMRLSQHFRVTSGVSPGADRSWEGGLWVADGTDALATTVGDLIPDSRPPSIPLAAGLQVGLYPDPTAGYNYAHSAEFDAPITCMLLVGGTVAGGAIAANCYVEMLTRIVAWEE